MTAPNGAIDAAGPVLARAATVGWREAMFEHALEVTRRGDIPDEDQRSADWRYLMRLSSDNSALVVGCGWGTVPCALAEQGIRVFAIDTDWQRAALLHLRGRDQYPGRITAVCASAAGLPFSRARFDLVAIHARSVPPTAEGLRRLLGAVREVLKPGGQLHILVGNRWPFQRLARPWRRGEARGPLTVGGYTRLLAREGFADLRLHAPLPSHDGIPLFYVPLDDPTALKFFLQDIFPLFNAVSPEVKVRFRREFALARFGAALALRTGLTRFGRFFVPGVSIIGTRTSGGSRAV